MKIVVASTAINLSTIKISEEYINDINRNFLYRMIEHAVCFEFFHSCVLLSKNSWKAFFVAIV